MKKFKIVVLLFYFQSFISCENDPVYHESIYYAKSDSVNNRILLFEKKYFVWISKHYDVDTILQVRFGKLDFKSDTIYFSPPDTIDETNRLFCFCKTEYDTEKKFQFYNITDKYPPDKLDNVYMMLFKKEKPNLPEVRIFGHYIAVRKSNSIEFIEDGQKYELLE